MARRKLALGPQLHRAWPTRIRSCLERKQWQLPAQNCVPGPRAGTYVMHFANSGEMALEQLTNGIEPTLIVILSDINMPGMDGLQLLETIKVRFPNLPMMMVTAYGDAERRRRANELGAFEFVTKPVDFDLLKTQLSQLPTAAGPQASP
jgi:CheY-like chemotaxis protein